MVRSAYFKVPSGFMQKFHLVIDKGEVDDTIIDSGNLDPDKYYEIVSITAEFSPNFSFVVGDIITGISKDITGKGSVKEISSTYPLDENKFEAFDCGVTDLGKCIIHVNLKRHWIKQAKRLIRLVNQTDFSTEVSRQILKIENAFIGWDEQSVFNMFPEMEDITVIDEVETRRLSVHTFAHDLKKYN